MFGPLLTSVKSSRTLYETMTRVYDIKQFGQIVHFSLNKRLNYLLHLVSFLYQLHNVILFYASW